MKWIRTLPQGPDRTKALQTIYQGLQKYENHEYDGEAVDAFAREHGLGNLWEMILYESSILNPMKTLLYSPLSARILMEPILSFRPAQTLMKTMAPLKISIIASPANVIQCRSWNKP